MKHFLRLKTKYINKQKLIIYIKLINFIFKSKSLNKIKEISECDHADGLWQFE